MTCFRSWALQFYIQRQCIAVRRHQKITSIGSAEPHLTMNSHLSPLVSDFSYGLGYFYQLHTSCKICYTENMDWNQDSEGSSTGNSTQTSGKSATSSRYWSPTLENWHRFHFYCWTVDELDNLFVNLFPTWAAFMGWDRVLEAFCYCLQTLM